MSTIFRKWKINDRSGRVFDSPRRDWFFVSLLHRSGCLIVNRGKKDHGLRCMAIYSVWLTASLSLKRKAELGKPSTIQEKSCWKMVVNFKHTVNNREQYKRGILRKVLSKHNYNKFNNNVIKWMHVYYEKIKYIRKKTSSQNKCKHIWARWLPRHRTCIRKFYEEFWLRRLKSNSLGTGSTQCLAHITNIFFGKAIRQLV